MNNFYLFYLTLAIVLLALAIFYYASTRHGAKK